MKLLKKSYLFIYNHIQGVVQLWLLLLIPCAISKHFAAWMLTANIALWLLLICGNVKGWRDEPARWMKRYSAAPNNREYFCSNCRELITANVQNEQKLYEMARYCNKCGKRMESDPND